MFDKLPILTKPSELCSRIKQFCIPVVLAFLVGGCSNLTPLQKQSDIPEKEPKIAEITADEIISELPDNMEKEVYKRFALIYSERIIPDLNGLGGGSAFILSIKNGEITLLTSWHVVAMWYQLNNRGVIDPGNAAKFFINIPGLGVEGVEITSVRRLNDKNGNPIDMAVIKARTTLADLGEIPIHDLPKNSEDLQKLKAIGMGSPQDNEKGEPSTQEERKSKIQSTAFWNFTHKGIIDGDKRDGYTLKANCVTEASKNGVSTGVVPGFSGGGVVVSDKNGQIGIIGVLGRVGNAGECLVIPVTGMNLQEDYNPGEYIYLPN